MGLLPNTVHAHQPRSKEAVFLGSVTKHHDVGSATASQQALLETRALLMQLRASATPTAHYKSSLCVHTGVVTPVLHLSRSCAWS